ncbi:polymer-forming cytoskeletal protein [Salmonella enterica]|nr:polymer-forming cytoskeletal protein [Salmonella enterica]EEB2924889.1 polymer-forming cytoskeletal protein [Salmonella enterica]
MLIPANKEEGTPGPVRPDLCKKAIEPETGSEAVKFKSGPPPPGHYMFCLTCFFWTAGLAALVLQKKTMALLLSGLALVVFGFYFLPEVRSELMFSRKKPLLQDKTKAEPDCPEAMSLAVQAKATTVIGTGAVVDGNISCGQGAEIYGVLTGEISLPEGTVRILPGGRVNGNISASAIIIGGVVEGRCEGQTVTVLEQGTLRGTCCSAEFSIKPGGGFIGNAEAWPEPVSPGTREGGCAAGAVAGHRRGALPVCLSTDGGRRDRDVFPADGRGADEAHTAGHD